MGEEQFDQTPVGCGPFALVADGADLSSGFEMTAFDGWYGGRPLLDKIEVTIIAEPSSRISALEAGDVDMLDIVPPIGVAQLTENPDITLVQTSRHELARSGDELGPSTLGQPGRAHGRRQGHRSRRAHPDRALWAGRGQYRGHRARVRLGLHSARPDDHPTGIQPRRSEGARRESRHHRRQADDHGHTGRPAPIRGATRSTHDLSLDVQIEQLQQAAWNERWLAGDYDWIINGSVVDADPDDGHWNFFYSEGPWNTYGYKNEQVDELLLASRSTADQETRADQFHQIQSILQGDVPHAFLYHTLDTTGFYNDCRGTCRFRKCATWRPSGSIANSRAGNTPRSVAQQCCPNDLTKINRGASLAAGILTLKRWENL